MLQGAYSDLVGSDKAKCADLGRSARSRFYFDGLVTYGGPSDELDGWSNPLTGDVILYQGTFRSMTDLRNTIIHEEVHLVSFWGHFLSFSERAANYYGRMCENG